jgi:thioredoxin-dependent peroxiredoxin
MLSVGDSAPDFTLPDQEGNPVTLSELRGQPVYFYPRADTKGHKSSRS